MSLALHHHHSYHQDHLGHKQDHQEYQDHKSLMARQLKLEREMANKGRERYFANVGKAKEKGRESQTSYGITLLKTGIEPIAKDLDALIEKYSIGTAGRRPRLFSVLKDADTKAVAFIALRKFLDMLSEKQLPLLVVAKNIGQAVDLELKLEHLKKTDNDRYKATQHFLKGTQSGAHRARVFKYAFGKSQSVAFEPLSEADTVQIGVNLLELIQKTLGLFTKQLVKIDGRKSKNATYIIRPTENILQWIEKHKDTKSLFTPDFLPMIMPPKPWTSAYDGGYYSDDLPCQHLVKVRDRDYLNKLDKRIEQGKMDEVLKSVNALQDTAWKVNTQVLSVVQHLWDNTSCDMAGLPPKEPYNLPLCPICGQTLISTKEKDHACFEVMSAEQDKEWRIQAKRIHSLNASMLSKQMSVAHTLKLAQRFAKEESLYFPYQLDFRGRIYAIPSYLTPQGTDLAKGLLTFSQGIPLGTQEAVNWLAVHGANTWGNDKVSFEDRIAWVKDNEERILATAQDPFSHKWWHDADSPFCFLAFCYEWAGYKQEGLAFESSLPIAMDGTCNGLQIYSLLLKDEIGGQAVNLVPQETPQDIYGIVAEKVVERVKADALKDPKHPSSSFFTKKDPTKEFYNIATCGKYFAQQTINRKTTKRQVMVLPYGGTYESCKDYTFQWIEENTNANSDTSTRPQGHSVTQLTHYLAKHIWESIEDTVTKAPEAMTFLQKTTSVINGSNNPLLWETPSGLLVKQEYKETKRKCVKTHLGDVIQLYFQEELPDTINKAKQKNSIAPNFVHSLDASALMHTVSLAKQDKGIEAFAMIHDSYGTHEANTENLAQTLRESFVDLFNAPVNLLTKWQEDVIKYVIGDDDNGNNDTETTTAQPINRKDLPKLPKQGKLDIEQLREAKFFFA